MNFLKGRLLSFKFAFKGLKVLWNEPNFRIHAVLFLMAVILSIYLEISSLEWMFILISSTLVFVAEGINTVVEKTMDFISTEQNKKIALIKDASAAFVLISAINAAIIGAIIFIPKFGL